MNLGDRIFVCVWRTTSFFLWLSLTTAVICGLMIHPEGRMGRLRENESRCVVNGPARIQRAGWAYYALVPMHRYDHVSRRYKGQCGSDESEQCFYQLPRDLDPRAYSWPRAKVVRELAAMRTDFSCTNAGESWNRVFDRAPSPAYHAAMFLMVIATIASIVSICGFPIMLAMNWVTPGQIIMIVLFPVALPLFLLWKFRSLFQHGSPFGFRLPILASWARCLRRHVT